MKFVPVPGTEVLFSIWETRVQDYTAYAAATNGVNAAWKNPVHEGKPVTPGPTHPVVNTSWEDAKKFCAWLTHKERGEGRISGQQEYRLPTDREWSTAVGLSGENGSPAKARDEGLKDVYPWGTQWPPPKGAGNYDSYSSSSLGTDSFDRASPVGSFAANAFGVFDLGGNVWEWCEDFVDAANGIGGLRGASWGYYHREFLLSSFRVTATSSGRSDVFGFRCVLTIGGSR